MQSQESPSYSPPRAEQRGDSNTMNPGQPWSRPTSPTSATSSSNTFVTQDLAYNPRSRSIGVESGSSGVTHGQTASFPATQQTDGGPGGWIFPSPTSGNSTRPPAVSQSEASQIPRPQTAFGEPQRRSPNSGVSETQPPINQHRSATSFERTVPILPVHPAMSTTMAPPEPQRRHSDGDQFIKPRSAIPGRLEGMPGTRNVRWSENLICPSPVFADQRRKGWFNRRGYEFCSQINPSRTANVSFFTVTISGLTQDRTNLPLPARNIQWILMRILSTVKAGRTRTVSA